MRGFSLFTPLVGTALMITAILASVTIVQNDVRLSRAITASYVASSTATNAKIILATTEISTAEGVKGTTLAFLSGSNPAYSGGRNGFQEIVCAASNCYNDIEQHFLPGMADALNDQALYQAMIEGVSTSTDYKAVLPDQYYENLGNQLASARPGKVEFTAFGRLRARIDAGELEACCGELLTVEFQDKNNPGNRVKLKVAPKEAEYESSRKLETIFKNAASAFEEIARAVHNAGIDADDVDAPREAALQGASAVHDRLFIGDDLARPSNLYVYVSDNSDVLIVVNILDMDGVTVTLALRDTGYSLGSDLPPLDEATVRCSQAGCT